jgi:hypothetical protein
VLGAVRISPGGYELKVAEPPRILSLPPANPAVSC